MPYTPSAVDVSQPIDGEVKAATAAAEFRVLKLYLRDVILPAIAAKASPTGVGASGTWPISITGAAGSVPWASVSGRPTSLAAFANDPGFIAASGAPVQSVAGRTGAVTLSKADVGLAAVDNKSSATIRSEISSADITTALGFTPYSAANPAGYLSSVVIPVSSVSGRTGAIVLSAADVGLSNVENKSSATILNELSSLNVTTALGFTPYNVANPAGYITAAGAPVQSVAGRAGTVTLTASDVGLSAVENKSSSTIRSEITSGNVTSALGFTPYSNTNPSGFITGSALSAYAALNSAPQFTGQVRGNGGAKGFGAITTTTTTGTPAGGSDGDFVLVY